jgi:hypothetical protein
MRLRINTKGSADQRMQSARQAVTQLLNGLHGSLSQIDSNMSSRHTHDAAMLAYHMHQVRSARRCHAAALYDEIADALAKANEGQAHCTPLLHGRPSKRCMPAVKIANTRIHMRTRYFVQRLTSWMPQTVYSRTQ